jgi:uncharacterized protein
MFSRVLLFSTAAAFAATAANAQTVGIGSTNSSMVAAMTAAISNVVSSKSILKMRRQVMGGTQKYIPVVDAGELEFGVANMIQYSMAKDGRVLSSRPYKNLQIVATLMRFRTGLLVKNDSDIKTVADLKGKRIPFGFKGAPLFDAFFKGMLGSGGLSYDDVGKVPTVGLAQSWNLFKQGKVDAVIAGVGGGPNKEMNSKIPSGIRYLSLPPDTAEAKEAIKPLRGGDYEMVNKDKAFIAIREPAVLIGYDFVLFVNKNVPVEAVYNVTKSLVDGVKDLHAVSPVWRSYNPERSQKDQGYEYHAGAMKLYKEKGLWKR